MNMHTFLFFLAPVNRAGCSGAFSRCHSCSRPGSDGVSTTTTDDDTCGQGTAPSLRLDWQLWYVDVSVCICICMVCVWCMCCVCVVYVWCMCVCEYSLFVLLSLSDNLALSLSLSLSLCLSLSHTHTLSLTHTHTLSSTHCMFVFSDSGASTKWAYSHPNKREASLIYRVPRHRHARHCSWYKYLFIELIQFGDHLCLCERFLVRVIPPPVLLKINNHNPYILFFLTVTCVCRCPSGDWLYCRVSSLSSE